MRHTSKAVNLLAAGGAACGRQEASEPAQARARLRSASILDAAALVNLVFDLLSFAFTFAYGSSSSSRGRLVSQLSRPQTWGLRTFNLNERLGALARTSSVRRRSAATRRSSPEDLRVEARQTNAPRAPSRSAARHQDGSQVPVSAFVVGLTPRHHPRRPNGPRLPCRARRRRGEPLPHRGQELPPGLRWAPAHSYLRHAPALWPLNHLADLARHREPPRQPDRFPG